MKTSELKQIVEEHGYTFQKTDQFIFISFYGLGKMQLDLQDHSITVDKNTILVTQSIKKIMVALIEYSLTPLNEREDEKKYRIVFDKTISTMNDCLTLRVTENTYYFSTFDYNDEFFQRIFTESEIDNFPAEIKGAIECGFLRKVEVEQNKPLLEKWTWGN